MAVNLISGQKRGYLFCTRGACNMPKSHDQDSIGFLLTSEMECKKDSVATLFDSVKECLVATLGREHLFSGCELGAAASCYQAKKCFHLRFCMIGV